MDVRLGRAVALAMMLPLAACTSDPTTTDAAVERGSEQPASPSPSPTTTAPVVPTGPVFLDLSTGTQTPLPSTRVEGDDQVRFDDGKYYVPSPDGSSMYWESVTDAAAVARDDGSGGRRLDPPGSIDYYAGGWSPDGTMIVYQRRDSSGNDFGNLVVEDVASGRTTQITDLEPQSADDVDGWWYLAPTFSPDGRSVIFHWPQASSSGTKWALWSVPVSGGEPTLLVRDAAQATTSVGPTWAFVRPKPDFFGGSSLVLATPDGFRTIVEALVEIFQPKISPDGSRIAYQDGAGSIYVVDVATGEASAVAVGRMAAWVDDETLIVAPHD